LSKIPTSTIEGPSTRMRNVAGRLLINRAAGSIVSSIQSSAGEGKPAQTAEPKMGT
jgi:hypothetical protein